MIKLEAIESAVRESIHEAMLDTISSGYHYTVNIDDDGDVVVRTVSGHARYRGDSPSIYVARPATWSHETWGNREADSDAERDEWIRDMEREDKYLIDDCVAEAWAEYKDFIA